MPAADLKSYVYKTDVDGSLKVIAPAGALDNVLIAEWSKAAVAAGFVPQGIRPLVYWHRRLHIEQYSAGAWGVTVNGFVR